MTKNIIYLKDHQFKPGFDPRRNLNGAPKGKNLRYAFAQEMYEKHKAEIEEVVSKVIQRALLDHDPSQKLVFDYFVIKPHADNTVNNCEDPPIFDRMCNIPKNELYDIRANIMDQLMKYNNDDEE